MTHTESNFQKFHVIALIALLVIFIVKLSSSSNTIDHENANKAGFINNPGDNSLSGK